MKFSLVHPSRTRIVRATEAIREWRAQASGRHEIEHILSVDADDPSVDAYRAVAVEAGSRLIVSANRRMIEAMNRGAEAATGDVIVGLSDDFGCPANWDTSLVDAIGGREFAAVLVDDAIDARILTLPILTAGLYRRLGYIYHPDYISMWADDDLTEVVRREQALVDARHLVFPHHHMSVARADADETYLRQNHRRSWWHGWRVYEKRKLEDFGYAPRTAAVRLRQVGVDVYYHYRTTASHLKRRLLRMDTT